MSVWLVRHGEPESDPRGRRYIGRTDVPISDAGRIQAFLLGQQFAAESDPEQIRIFTSPLMRCADTAEILAGVTGCRDPEILPELREIDLGKWEGRLISELRSQEPEAYEARGRDLWHYRTPGGESFAEAGSRFLKALQSCLAETTEETRIFVTHAGVIRAGLTLWTGEPFEAWMARRIPYAGRIELPPGPAGTAVQKGSDCGMSGEGAAADTEKRTKREEGVYNETDEDNRSRRTGPVP